MQLRQLCYFRAAAELPSFSRAAERLHIAQSALSRQIQALERIVGTRLLERDRTHVALTVAGRNFFRHTCELLASFDDAIEDTRMIAKGAKGELVVCTDWRIDSRLLSSTIMRFRHEHPGTEVRLHCSSHCEQLALLQSGDAQVGFVSRELIGRRSSLCFLPVGRVHVNAFVPKTHRLAARRHLRLAELADETWVHTAGSQACEFRRFLLQQCRLSGFTSSVECVAGSVDELFEMVARGYGIAAAPDHVQPPLDVAVVSIQTDCRAVEYGAVWRSGQTFV